MAPFYLQLSLLFFLNVYVVGAIALLSGKVVPAGHLKQRRNSWELRENTTFPGRKWGVEPRCASEPELANGARKDYMDLFLNAEQPSEMQRKGLQGLEVGPCSMAMPVPEWMRMRYVDIESHPEHNCVGQENQQLAETIIDDATTLQKVGNNTYDLFVIAHVMEHMEEVVRGMQTWMRILKPGGMAVIIVPHMCDRDVSGDHFRLLTKPEHFIHEFDSPTLAKNNFGEHMREGALCLWGFLNKEKPGFGEAQFFDDLGEEPSAQGISELAETCRQNPYSNHLHTFTETSVRDLLTLVQSRFPAESQFDVVDVSSWYSRVGDEIYLHGEVRVVLRKRCSDTALDASALSEQWCGAV